MTGFKTGADLAAFPEPRKVEIAEAVADLAEGAAVTCEADAPA